MVSDHKVLIESSHGYFLRRTASFLASNKRLIQFAGLLALIFSAAYFYWQYETKLQTLTEERIEDAKMLMIFIQNETTRIMGSGMFLNLEGAFKKINDTAYKKGVIVNIYRPDGREAFSDMRTVENVLSVALEQKDYEVKDIANIPVSEIISHAQEVLKRDRPKISESLFDSPEGTHAEEHFNEALINGESEDTSHPSIIEEFAKIDREECGDACHMGQNAVIRMVIDKKVIEETLAMELEWDMAKVSAFVGGLLLFVWLYGKQDEIIRREREQEREKHLGDLKNANEKLLNVTSDLSLKNELFKLVYQITVAANEALTAKDVILICLSKTCKHTGWPLGHAYKLVNEPDGTAVLKSTDLWYINSSKQFRVFKTVTKSTDLKHGEGLPGLVLKTGKPEWITDITESLNFPRLAKAKLMNEDIDVRGAFAFPVLEGEIITYVLEFFSEKPEELNELLLSVVAGLAIQIGRVTERKQADEALKKANNSLNESLEEVEVKNKLLEEQAGQLNKVTAQLRNFADNLEEKVEERTRELKITQTEKDQVVKQLIQAEKAAAVGVLTSGIGHEINNPLYAILGRAEAIEGGTGVERSRKFGRDIVKNCKRIGEIIKNLAKYVSPYSGDELESVDVNEKITEAVNMVRMSLMNDYIQIKEMCNSVPKVLGRSQEIQQIFFNIIRNGAQAIRGRGTVEIESCLEGDGVRISIKDDGPGISKENLNKIFDPFFTTKGPEEGEGLGLYIVQQTVKKNGGTLDVESQVGKGTVFNLKFPVKGKT